jgi:chloride channel protein, CIC family
MSAHLRDFHIERRRFARLCVFALFIGALAAFIAKFLLAVIGLITHIAYFGDLGASLIAPDPHRIGPLAIGIPVIGGLLVGCIARFATDKIRGHGIPEAIAAILEGQSIMQARVTFWKPLASAIAIGTGGPFGAEGPIIMTGGAFGSLCAQYFHLSSIERRTLLVCGASAGMAATFSAPIASVLIAVELLLFEWRPRSFVPVALAAFVAEIVRTWIIGSQPPFMVAQIPDPSILAIVLALVLGICGGVLSMIATKLVYWCEDLYEHLPLHWMWWPAIGGLVVGIGGWFVPQALGVGYPTIAGILNARLGLDVIVGIVVVKLVIWVVSLSSGTSGGVLAPLLMIGAALGALFAQVVPDHATTLWAISGMAALLGGTMRAPFMGTLFALETTHAWALAPEVFVACIAATTFTVLFVPRSILTEKLARRGVHVSRDYSVHPLELVGVSDVMRAPCDERPDEEIGASQRVRAAIDVMARDNVRELAVTDENGVWIGTMRAEDILRAWRRGLLEEERRRRTRRFRPHR